MGFGVGFEVYRTAGVLWTLQYPRNRFWIPLIEVFRHGLPIPFCIVRFDGQNLVCGQCLCNLHRPFSSNAQVKNPLDYLGGFLVHNPLFLVVEVFHIAIGRVAAKMFPGVALCPHDRADFLTGIAGIKIVEQVTEWGKIVVALVAVHTVVDGDIPYIALGKETLGVVADFQIIPPHAGHILDDNRFDLSRFRKAYHLIPAGSVERYPRYAVVNEKSWIWKAIVLCILQKDFLLVGYAVALSVQSVLL